MAAPGLSRTAVGQNGPVNPGVWTEDQHQVAVWPGQHQPLGATWSEEATNFAVYAPEATRVEVCLFDDDDTVWEQAPLKNLVRFAGRPQHISLVNGLAGMLHDGWRSSLPPTEGPA